MYICKRTNGFAIDHRLIKLRLKHLREEHFEILLKSLIRSITLDAKKADMNLNNQTSNHYLFKCALSSY